MFTYTGFTAVRWVVHCATLWLSWCHEVIGNCSSIKPRGPHSLWRLNVCWFSMSLWWHVAITKQLKTFGAPLICCDGYSASLHCRSAWRRSDFCIHRCGHSVTWPHNLFSFFHHSSPQPPPDFSRGCPLRLVISNPFSTPGYFHLL